MVRHTIGCGGGVVGDLTAETLKKATQNVASGNSSIGKKLSSRLSNPSVTETELSLARSTVVQVNEYSYIRSSGMKIMISGVLLLMMRISFSRLDPLPP